MAAARRIPRDRHQDRFAGRDQLARRPVRILGKQFGAGEDLLVASLHDPGVRHEALTCRRCETVDSEMRRHHLARHCVRGKSAGGVDQRADQPGVQKAGVLAGVFAPWHQQLNVAGTGAAVALAGQRVVHTLTELAATVAGPDELVRRYAALLGGWMGASGFRDGCPIATTLLETTQRSEPIRQAGEAALADWAKVFEDALNQRGVKGSRAARLAALAVASIEGALLQARVAADPQPLLDAAEEVALAFEAAIADAGGGS